MTASLLLASSASRRRAIFVDRQPSRRRRQCSTLGARPFRSGLHRFPSRTPHETPCSKTVVSFRFTYLFSTNSQSQTQDDNSQFTLHYDAAASSTRVARLKPASQPQTPPRSQRTPGPPARRRGCIGSAERPPIQQETRTPTAHALQRAGRTVGAREPQPVPCVLRFPTFSQALPPPDKANNYLQSANTELAGKASRKRRGCGEAIEARAACKKAATNGLNGRSVGQRVESPKNINGRAASHILWSHYWTGKAIDQSLPF